ncbi:MAG: ATP-binding protein [Coriobacteriales bacterium]|jgi:AAA+ ATPase superfamily predicted ATPase|nr:ATP-binding protein [Coriobacteriales bacterium]
MLVGREEELRELGTLYEKGGFQMVVVYGRRRVGKTTLLAEFAAKKPAIFFTAMESNDQENLRLFSRALYEYARLPASTGSFSDWTDAFDFLLDLAAEQQLVLVFDEFPFAAQANSSLPSILQNAIDHKISKSQVYMVLSGSNVGFMEDEVLGHRSPLYGRRTAQMHLLPFDYLDASKMLGETSREDCIRYYSCLGGVPYYLSFVDTAISFEDNLISLFFNRTSVFSEEPLMMLRQQLREPAIYNTILMALANGANTPQLIADQIGEERTKVMKYLGILSRLCIVKKIVPLLSDQAKTRKGVYRISDQLFSFWYRYLFPIHPEIELGSGELLARKKIFPYLSEHTGRCFEDVCIQWIRRKNQQSKLPFTATAIGSWWGTDSKTKQQADVDAMAIDQSDGKLLLGECKWQESIQAATTLNKLCSKTTLFPDFKDIWFYLFSKAPFDAASKRMVRENNRIHLVGLPDLFMEDPRT